MHITQVFNTTDKHILLHSTLSLSLKMASKASSFLSLVLISNILIAIAVAGRTISKNTNTQQDKKEPQFLFKSHDRVYIPGIGPVGFPPKFHVTPHNPFTHGNGGVGAGTGSGTGTGTGPGTGTGTGTGSGSTGRSYVPGGDDTFVPNPGYEVPIPGSGGNVPAPFHP
ncbi:putative cell wall protein [Vigna radiata var. radiata]|uniref:Cell wall protein n=1 Tax=Vigna radiata var. radiata TaxID=3916 RepID=A0A1S3TIV4_VIGRR|nr:putative cell wall protein [Vigna radiata var. radiata]